MDAGERGDDMLIDVDDALRVAWAFCRDNFEPEDELKVILKQELEQKSIVFQKCPHSLDIALAVEGIRPTDITDAIKHDKLSEWCLGRREDIYRGVIKIVEDLYRMIDRMGCDKHS